MIDSCVVHVYLTALLMFYNMPKTICVPSSVPYHVEQANE